MQTIKRINRAVIDVTLRVVVAGNFSDKTVGDAVDNFLNRALQTDIPPELYTEGLISATMVGTAHTLHAWEELECKEL